LRQSKEVLKIPEALSDNPMMVMVFDDISSERVWAALYLKKHGLLVLVLENRDWCTQDSLTVLENKLKIYRKVDYI